MFHLRFQLLLSLLLVSTLSPSLWAQAHSETPPTRSPGTRKQGAGLSNFGEVTPNLYRGAHPSAEGIKTLHGMGISIVVDMRGSSGTAEQAAVEKFGMQYISIPWHCPFPSDEPLIKFLKVIEQNPGKKIFVHCRLGDDRTGMAIASYRMAEEGWSADEAMKEMVVFGFNTFHHVICPTLAHFEREFPSHLKTNPAFKELQAMKK